ncbi:DUF6418 domain-containing protein [Bradyrhizobium lablabi]|uniref:DUF6418 domain-containing protein n=1 Tax=Bradyrhizobium lablabi TaxID=722472 RepID=UPI001BAC9153|nr:DUF6418 domain-containing protein [Bradyrhizobium lablabi]MBR0694888.1 hypothetical protein [Bradyrhizobium lablabi]
MILSFLSAGCVLAAMGWIVFRRPALALIFLFVLFAFAWRLVSTFYIDSFGPVASEQLERSIGPGISVVPLAISQGLVIAAMLLSFHPRRLRELAFRDQSPVAALTPSGHFKLSDLAYWAALSFVLALWIELFVVGSIPLFVAIERTDYLAHYAGPLHQRLIEWGPMLAFQFGVFFAMPALRAESFDRRFGALFVSLLAYLFLVGHRFSSFYAYSTFFLIPLGAVLLQKQVRGLSVRELLPGRTLRYFSLAAGACALLVVVAISYSYLVVRSADQVGTKLSERILVQQGEMWWMTYERIFLRGDWDIALAFDRLFVDPFDPTRNSTMQFLMELALPVSRAHFILAQGAAYTGGWPEVFFELGGPVGGFVLVALSAVAFSEFMFLIVRCFVQERFVTCLFLTPILFTLSINIVSGMVNSFIQLTFVVKIVAAMLAYVTEEQWRSRLLSTAVRTSDSLQAPATR